MALFVQTASRIVQEMNYIGKDMTIRCGVSGLAAMEGYWDDGEASVRLLMYPSGNQSRSV